MFYDWILFWVAIIVFWDDITILVVCVSYVVVCIGWVVVWISWLVNTLNGWVVAAGTCLQGYWYMGCCPNYTSW